MTLRKTIVMVLINPKKLTYIGSAKQMSDVELVKKVKGTSDSQLFGVLYDRYSNKVYNKCFSFTKNENEAKDLTQDIFLKVFLKLNLYKEDKASFSTWLYVITYNSCSNYVNRNKKKNKSERLSEHEYYIREDQTTDIDELNALDPIKVGKALDLLVPEEKSLLLLKYQDNVSIKELQATLGLGESAIKMRLNRAKTKVVKIYNTL